MRHDALRSIDPCVYGAPRCPCVTVEGQPQTCLERPCGHTLDRSVLGQWQEDDPIAYQRWNTEECLLAIRAAQRGITGDDARCPVCRVEWGD